MFNYNILVSYNNPTVYNTSCKMAVHELPVPHLPYARRLLCHNEDVPQYLNEMRMSDCVHSGCSCRSVSEAK